MTAEPTPAPHDMITAEDAAKILDVTRARVYQLVTEGALTRYITRKSDPHSFHRGDVEALRAHRAQAVGRHAPRSKTPPPERERITIDLPPELAAEARGAVMLIAELAHTEGPTSLKELVEHAVTRDLARLRAAHNHGQPFPPRARLRSPAEPPPAAPGSRQGVGIVPGSVR